jgi:hypothetical protein
MIYPLPMRFPVPINGGPQHIDITITPEGWSFITIGDRQGTGLRTRGVRAARA